jgi:hypothetical protein
MKAIIANKKLNTVCNNLNCSIELISYKGNGQTLKGFDLVKQYGEKLVIQAQVEPVNYSNGDKWKVQSCCDDSIKLRYFKNLSQVAKHLNTLTPIEFTGYTLRK